MVHFLRNGEMTVGSHPFLPQKVSIDLIPIPQRDIPIPLARTHPAQDSITRDHNLGKAAQQSAEM